MTQDAIELAVDVDIDALTQVLNEHRCLSDKVVGNRELAKIIKDHLAANGYLRTPDKWQPIETAPRDGTEILVCMPRMMNLIVRARYNKIHKHWGDDERGACFYHPGDLWMPLPPPPEKE